MVGLPYDFLANPLGAVRSTFEKAIASGSDPSSFDGKDWGAIEIFRSFLYDQGGLSKVPVLNSATIGLLQPNTLVRFRGMVQDMLGNEFYAGAFKDGSVWRTNKFMDISQFTMGSSPDMRIWERQLFYCVPVPGQNLWAEVSSEVVMNLCPEWASQEREKRRRTDGESLDDMDMVSAAESQGSPCTKKMREDGHLFKGSTSQGTLAESNGSIAYLMPNVKGDLFPCLVKIYDSLESSLKLNDVSEFVGVLTFDLEPRVDKDENDEFSNQLFEDALTKMHSNMIPRLHCLIHRKLAAHDFLKNPPLTQPNLHMIKEVRQNLLRYLTRVLGNDDVAASFTLLHLLSKVHARVDSVAVGKLSLNLTGFSKESVSIFGSGLSLAVKNLLPFTKFIPLTMEYLNRASLAPKKDYDTNRLLSGDLQLPEGSHLIIDETKLEAGTLNSIGVENARLLKTLMELQKVEYDFKYYKMDIAADFQLLILSEGKSNILPADMVVPLRPSEVASIETVDSVQLESWRWYLATQRLLPHAIESDMQKVIEDDLVAARQSDRSLGSHDFSRWLTMGRLISASFGETCLSLEHWQMVKELERIRRERLN